MRTVTTFLLIFVLNFAYSQASIQSESSIPKENVLYLGINNPVDIELSGLNWSDLSVTIKNGALTGKNGKYMVKPKKLGNTIITISHNDDEILKTTFIVKKIPNPMAMVAGKGSGNISKKTLLEATEVEAVIKDLDIDLDIEVLEFTLTINTGGFVIQYHTKSNIISQEQKKKIAYAKPGNRVYFENIKYRINDGEVRNLTPIIFVITGD